MTMIKYVPIRVSTLRGDLKIPFDAYVHVAGKYILFCREGDSFEGERLERLRSKKLLKMFIPSEQNKDYHSYLRRNIDLALDSNRDKPIQIRAEVIHGALQASTEDLMEDPSSSALYTVAIEGAKRFVKFFFSEPQALKAMLEIKNSDYSVAHHGVIVAALALAIADEMLLAESHPMQMETLAVGAMVHDIEHFYSKIDFSRPYEDLTHAEQVIHLRHTIEGEARLNKEAFYDPLIPKIVGYHEEKIDGSGPRKQKEKEMNPLVQVVSTANHFDHLLLYGNLSPKDALKKLLIDKMGVLSLETMRALQDSLKKRDII